MTVHMVPSASGSTTTPKKPVQPEPTPVSNAPPSPSINPNNAQNNNNNFAQGIFLHFTLLFWFYLGININGGAFPNPGGMGGFGSLFGNLMGGQNNQGGQQNFMQSMQQQILSNPQLMQQMMQNPLVQQLNQQIMNNPEMLREMIRNNPMMNDIIERNPEVSHILNDPSTLRQAVQMSQNPELLRVNIIHFSTVVQLILNSK